MSVLTFQSSEYKTFPPILIEYSRYLAAIKGNAEKTICEYLLDIRNFFRFLRLRSLGEALTREVFENLPIKDLTIAEVTAVKTDDIIEYLVFAGFERKNSATTRMRKLCSLRSLYKYMSVKKNYMDHDPCANVDAPRAGKSLPKYLTYEECIRFIDAVKYDTESPTQARDYAIIILFLNTGMRLSELVALNLQSISSDLSTIRVIGKGSKERILYLNDMAKAALKAHLEVRLDPRFIKTGDNALFLSRLEKRISAKTIQWLVYKYLNLAGLGHKKLSVHKLRHTAATLMYQTGQVDIRVLKDVLGHEQLNTTQIYTHVVSRNVQDAMSSNPLSSKNKK